jgi:hypothetical protein
MCAGHHLPFETQGVAAVISAISYCNDAIPELVGKVARDDRPGFVKSIAQLTFPNRGVSCAGHEEMDMAINQTGEDSAFAQIISSGRDAVHFLNGSNDAALNSEKSTLKDRPAAAIDKIAAEKINGSIRSACSHNFPVRHSNITSLS